MDNEKVLETRRPRLRRHGYRVRNLRVSETRIRLRFGTKGLGWQSFPTVLPHTDAAAPLQVWFGVLCLCAADCNYSVPFPKKLANVESRLAWGGL